MPQRAGRRPATAPGGVIRFGLAAAGLQTSTGELAAARRLDAEDATMRQVLAWAMDHDVAIGLRLAVALAPWWLLWRRLAGEYPLLTNLGRLTEAAANGRRSLALARELGYPAGEALALAGLSVAAYDGDDLGSAVRLARQAGQITADIPGWIARLRSYFLTEVLTAVGELAAAERVCAAGLAQSREAGDLWNLVGLLPKMATLDLRAGRAGDAAAHLREALQIAARTGAKGDALDGLDRCGYLCAATGRRAEALTVWAASAALFQHEGYPEAPPYTRRRQEPRPSARSERTRTRCTMTSPPW